MVEITTRPEAAEHGPVAAWYLESPQPGIEDSQLALDLRGWVLGRDRPPEGVTVSHGNVVHLNLRVSGPRPDVGDVFPFTPGAKTSGFAGSLGLLGLPPECTLELAAYLNGGWRVPLVELDVSRPPLKAIRAPRMRPLLVTTLGRSGSTFLMNLLAAHPAIAVHHVANYETRAITFWAHALELLVQPQCMPYGGESFGHFHVTDCAEHREWFENKHVERAVAFCHASLEAFYDLQVSCLKTEALYVAEKSHADRIPWIVWELYPRHAREIILVRDPRDMYCSIRAFNEKRGYLDFRRGEVETEREYVQVLAHEASGLESAWLRRGWQAHLLRYEDLVREPEATLAAALGYLDLDARPRTVRAMIKYAREDAARAGDQVTAASAESSIGRWREELDPEFAEFCNRAFRSFLDEFGYDE